MVPAEKILKKALMIVLGGGNIRSAELNKMLVNKFPNLREKYLEEVNWQEGDDTGSHVVYGDVLTPYLVECIASNYKQDMRVIFNFLEELLRLNDKYADEVVSFSVLESISYLFKERTDLTLYLGEKSLNALNCLI